MKQTFLIFFLCFCTFKVFAQESVTIKGKVQFTDPHFKMIAYRSDGFKKDTLGVTEVTSENTYQLCLPVDKPGLVTLNCGNWQSVNFWLEDENLEINFRGKDTARVKIKNPPFVYIQGGKNNELMNLINFEAYRNYQHLIAVSQAAYHANFKSEEERQKLSMGLYDFGNENYQEHLRFFVNHYADRSSVLAAIRGLDYEKDSLLILNAFTRLKENCPSTILMIESYVKENQEKQIRKHLMSEGNPLPSFDCYTESGKSIQISDYIGKIIVLDFWASWCGPCRQEIPNLKSIYQEFKNQDVEILSVSIDSKKSDWQKALKQEQMPWTQAWVKDSGKSVMHTMQFSGIPFILILDRQGRIYKKHVRGNEIKKSLQDLINGKPVQKSSSISFAVGM